MIATALVVHVNHLEACRRSRSMRMKSIRRRRIDFIRTERCSTAKKHTRKYLEKCLLLCARSLSLSAAALALSTLCALALGRPSVCSPAAVVAFRASVRRGRGARAPFPRLTHFEIMRPLRHDATPHFFANGERAKEAERATELNWGVM